MYHELRKRGTSLRRMSGVAAVILAAFVCGVGVGQVRLVREFVRKLELLVHPSDEPNYFLLKVQFFRELPGTTDVVMLGDSLTEQGPWAELFPRVRIINRGIFGDTTDGVLYRLDEVIERHPRLVFLMIGANDLVYGVPVSTVATKIRSIVQALRRGGIEVALQTPLLAAFAQEQGFNAQVRELNRSLSDLCPSDGIVCIDLNKTFAADGALSPRFTWDGFHLTAAGYVAWRDAIAPQISAIHESGAK